MFCPNCGNQMSDGIAFCGNCGHQLAQPIPRPVSSARRRGLIALIAVILVIVALAAGWFFVGSWLGQQSLVAGSGSERDDSEKQTAIANASETDTPPESATKTSTPINPAALSPAATPFPSKTPTFVPSSTPIPTNTITPIPTLTPSPSVTPDPSPEMMTIGYSVGGVPIEAVRFGNGPQNIIFIGGLHAGFAPSTVTLARQTVDYFTQNPEGIPDNLTVYIIISVSPDSPIAPGELRGRLNANDVDLNRNWGCEWVQDARWRGNIVRGSGGSSSFSEPETQSLRDFILDKKATAVIFWEAKAKDGLASPGSCGDRSPASETLATTYGFAAGYQIADFEELTNQTLNGDGANWLDQQGFPAIAVLLPEYTSVDWENNREGILAVLQQYAE